MLSTYFIRTKCLRPAIYFFDESYTTQNINKFYIRKRRDVKMRQELYYIFFGWFTKSQPARIRT